MVVHEIPVSLHLNLAQVPLGTVEAIKILIHLLHHDQILLNSLD